jgi:general secretion pathway protein L
MPPKWQERLQHALRRVVVQLKDGSMTIDVDESRKLSPLEQLPISNDVEWQRRQIFELLENNGLDETMTVYALELDSILCKQLSLPVAAESNLSQVIAFEMDRQTPFKASEVYYDWQIIEREAGGQLRMKLFLVPRQGVDEALQTLSTRGFKVGGVDALDGDKPLGLNMLPVAVRQRVVNRKARANYALALVVLALIAVVMAQSLYLRKHQVDELQDAISSVQGEARSVMKIKEEIRDSSEAAGFLASRRAESPLAIELLADITQLLPDNTYLDRLVIGRETVQLQGKSQNAQQLIELVNGSELLDNAAFRGSTRLDARTGLEIFEVNAEIDQARSGSD